MAKRKDAFLRTEYLDNGKGKAVKMIVITAKRLREVINAAVDAEEVAAESIADDVVEAVLGYCEDVDAPEDEGSTLDLSAEWRENDGKHAQKLGD